MPHVFKYSFYFSILTAELIRRRALNEPFVVPIE